MLFAGFKILYYTSVVIAQSLTSVNRNKLKSCSCKKKSCWWYLEQAQLFLECFFGFLPVFGWNQFLGSQKHSRRFHNHKRCETKLHVEWKWRSTWHFLTQQNSLIMPKINLNLLRKLASLVTEVNSRWFWALKKNFASLKKILTFYASSIQQISIFERHTEMKDRRI